MFKKHTNRKGQAAFSSGTLITLIMGVGVSVLVLILLSVVAGKTYENSESDISAIQGLTSVNNQTTTFINNTAYDLGHKDINTGSLSVFEAVEISNTEIGLGNFTIDYGLGVITRVTINNVTNGDIFINLSGVNYTYGSNSIKSGIGESILNSFEGMEQTGELLPLIVLAFIMIFILSMVMGLSVLSPKNDSGGGNAL